MQGSGGYSILGSNSSAKLLLDGVATTMLEIEALSAQDVWRVEVERGGIDGDRINIIRRRSLKREFGGQIGARASLPIRYSANSSVNYQTPTIYLSIAPSVTYDRQRGESMMERHSSSMSDTWHYQTEFDLMQSYGALRLNFTPSKRWNNTVVLTHSRMDGDESTASRWNAQAAQMLHARDYQHALDGHIASKYAWGNSFLRLRGHLALEAEKKDMDMGNGVSHRAKNRYRGLTGDLTYQTLLEGRYGKHRLSYNYAISYRQTRSVYNPIDQNDLIHSFKVGDAVSLGERWGSDVVLLLQHDTQRYMTVARKNWYLLPYASVYYNGSGYALELSYGQGIFHPSGAILDPTKYYKSDTHYTQGNPDISSERIYQLALRYQKQINRALVSSALSYVQTDDVIGLVNAVSDPNLQTWANVGKRSVLGLSLGVYSSFFDRRLSLNLSTSLGYVNNQLASRHHQTALSRGGKGLIYQGNLSMSYTTSKNWTYMLYGQWSGRSLDFSQKIDYAPYIYLDIDKMVIPGKLSLSLSVLNPWGKMKHRHESLFDGISQKQWFRSSATSSISIGLTYYFGKSFEAREGNETISIDDRKNK